LAYFWPVWVFSSGGYNLWEENTGDGGGGPKRRNPRGKNHLHRIMRRDLAHLNTLPGKLNDLSDCYPDIDRGLLPVIVPLVKLALKALEPTG
jgi:hypothetical protein